MIVASVNGKRKIHFCLRHTAILHLYAETPTSVLTFVSSVFGPRRNADPWLLTRADLWVPTEVPNPYRPEGTMCG